MASNGQPDYSQTPNQDNSTDNQNFDIDVNKLASHWLSPLDELRSKSGINPQNTATLKQLIQSGKFSFKQIDQVIKMEGLQPQESRCHAFYRWIGFPVCDQDKKIYNPGHNNEKDPSITIDFTAKSNIAKRPIPGFDALSLAREKFVQSNLDIFSDPQSIDAGVLALSSGGNANLRKFVVPFDKSTDAFDMVVTNQSFQVDFDGLVGDNLVTLDKYQDANGHKPTQVSATRTHIIKPFIVDARIDFAVNPKKNLVAVPFVADQQNLRMGSPDYVVRPLLEKIIRERFTVDDPTENIGSASNKLIQFIADFPDLKDNDLIKLANNPNNILKRSDQLRLAQTINTIKSLMQKLVDAQRKISDAQQLHYWLPAPSTSGPEGGSDIQGVFFPNVIDATLVVDKDADIFFSQTKDLLNRLTASGITASGEPSAGAFGLSTDKISFGPDTTDAMGDNNSRNLKTLTKSRSRLLTEASTALQTIEIIMGEFSGFGLCDIIAIISALETVQKEDLIGFLDEDAKARMLTAMKLDSVNGNSYETAMSNLSLQVKNFYDLMDKIYQDLLNNPSS
jgi:hypothetical protein